MRKEGILCTNNRLDSLFNKLGITGRMISGTEEIEECLERTIDYETVHENIEGLVKSSKEYLKHALNIE